MSRLHPLVVPYAELDPTPNRHELVDADHGDVPFSFILVKSGPDTGSGVDCRAGAKADAS